MPYDPQAEMEAFDALPKAVREFMSFAPVGLYALEVRVIVALRGEQLAIEAIKDVLRRDGIAV